MLAFPDSRSSSTGHSYSFRCKRLSRMLARFRECIIPSQRESPDSRNTRVHPYSRRSLPPIPGQYLPYPIVPASPPRYEELYGYGFQDPAPPPYESLFHSGNSRQLRCSCSHHQLQHRQQQQTMQLSFHNQAARNYQQKLAFERTSSNNCSRAVDGQYCAKCNRCHRIHSKHPSKNSQSASAQRYFLSRRQNSTVRNSSRNSANLVHPFPSVQLPPVPPSKTSNNTTPGNDTRQLKRLASAIETSKTPPCPPKRLSSLPENRQRLSSPSSHPDVVPVVDSSVQRPLDQNVATTSTQRRNALSPKRACNNAVCHDTWSNPEEAKELLDKLMVVCPNVDYCEEVLPRCELEAHLKHKCRGAVVSCPQAPAGCPFQGPRSAQSAHRWECAYKNEIIPPLAGARQHDMIDSGSASGGAGKDSGANGGSGSVGGSGDGAVGRELHAYNSIDRPDIIEGEVTTIEIERGGSYDLGFSFVGGIDTPLMCILIQEIYLDGVVAQDGRLRPGDQLLEVNGVDLTQATHAVAKRALCMLSDVTALTVYREKVDDVQQVDKDEIINVKLSKRNENKLGIKLVGKKNRPGLYVLGLIRGGEADIDGRLKKDDRILEINGVDLSEGTQEQAAHIIASATDIVSITIVRRLRPQTPDIIRTASGENITDCANLMQPPTDLLRRTSLRSGHCRQRDVRVLKEPTESLGISVAGGINSQRGDTPVYITNVVADGCLGRTKQVKKGDVLLRINNFDLLGLSHDSAVNILKQVSQSSREVILRLLEGPESSSGPSNFMPSWAYWLQLPRTCHMPRVVYMSRDQSGSLGFSIVGGSDCVPPTSVAGGPHPMLLSDSQVQPIVVKSIVPGSVAHNDGNLKCGDILISVNNYPLFNISHAHAVTLLKHVRGDVCLQVVSWPGTIV